MLDHQSLTMAQILSRREKFQFEVAPFI